MLENYEGWKSYSLKISKIYLVGHKKYLDKFYRNGRVTWYFLIVILII